MLQEGVFFSRGGAEGAEETEAVVEVLEARFDIIPRSVQNGSNQFSKVRSLILLKCRVLADTRVQW